MAMRHLKIDPARWLRGARDEGVLANDCQEMCILGFLLADRGVPPAAMRGMGYPGDLVGHNAVLTSFALLDESFGARADVESLININGDVWLDDRTRLEHLTRVLARYDYEPVLTEVSDGL